MKKILFYLVLCLPILLNAQVNQTTNLSSDTITINDSLKLEVGTWVRGNGTPCSPLDSLIDTAFSNTIEFGLVHDFTGNVINSCYRLDTINYQPLPVGNYQIICYRCTVNYNFPSQSPFRYLHRYYSDTLQLVVQNITSLKENSKSNVIISPNPVKNILTIRNINQPIDNIRLWNIKGQLLEQINFSSNEIDISEMPSGLIIMKIQVGENSYQTKFIKE